MKKLLVTIAALVAASSAQAGKLNLDVRFDSDSATFNTDSGKPGYQKYTVQTGRVDWNGAVNEELAYRLRLRFDKDQGSVNKRDNVNDTVDLAYFTHKMGDFTLIGGKFDAGMNGFEGATNGADLYFKSQAYSSTTYGALRYGTGAGVVYAYGDHVFTLANMNAISDELDSSGNFAQTNTIGAFIYKGAFIDKSLNVIASYHQTHLSGDKDGALAFIVAGIKYEQPAWFVSLDANMNSYKNVSATNNTDTLNSYVLNAGYNINESWTAKAKFESSVLTKKPTAGDNKYTTTGLGAAVEYKPIKDTNFRYHLAYTNVAIKNDPATGTGLTPTESHVVLGARLMADFLK